MDLISSVVNRVKEVARNMGKRVSDNEGFIRQGQFTPVHAVRDYFNPISNQGRNFWSTPVAQRLANLQTAVEKSRYEMPKVSLERIIPQVKTPYKPVNLVANLPINLARGVAEGVINAPVNAWQTGARIGYDIVNIPRGNVKLTPQRVLSDIAPGLEAYLSVAGLGLGKQAIKEAGKELAKGSVRQAIKKGALGGALYGGGFGLAGAASSKEFAEKQNVGSLVEPTLTGAAGGALIGAAARGVPAAIGALFNKVKSAIREIHPNQPPDWIDKQGRIFVRNELGRFVGLKPLVKEEKIPIKEGEKIVDYITIKRVYPTGKEPRWYGDVREKIGLPREGLTSENIPFGLSTKPKGGMKAVFEAEKAKIKIKGEPMVEGSQTGDLPKIGENVSQFTETVKTSPKTPKKIREVVENAYYRPTTNVQDIANAQNTLNVLGWDKAKEKLLKEPLTSENSMLGQIMASRAFKEGKFDEGNEIIKNLSLKATKSGQSIQALSVWSKFTPEGMVKFAQKEIENANNSMPLLNKILGKKGEWTAEDSKFITEQMKKINTLADEAQKAEATREVFDYISKKLPWGASDLIDEFRYNNMLSNPLTHLRNAVNNLQQAFFVRPATLVAEGKPIEAVKYEIGALKSLPDAFNAFKQALRGKETFGKMDVSEIGSQLQKPKRLGAYNLPSNAMEAADKFFSTLIIGGEKARGKSAEEALKSAEYSLFRQALKPEQQGFLLNKIDDITGAVYQLRKVGLGWFIPFIRTPMNVAKQWIEYSPAGFATTIGAANKREQVAKAILGTLATAIGADLALQDRVTWAAPTDPLQKKLFYDSGRKPYSIKIGDKWIPMQTVGVFAWALGIPAAVKYYTQESREALSDDQITKLAKIMTSIAGFWSNQTFVSGLASFVKMAEGDIDYNLPKNIGYTLGQLKPMEGLMRYVATVIDPVFRKPKTIGEQLISDIPFLTKQLPAYETTLGEPATRNITNYIMPYAWGFENKQFEEPYKLRTKQLQENALINKTKREMEGGSKQVGNKLLITSQDGNVKVLDLSKIIPSDTDTNYQKALKRKKAFSYVDDILDSNMSIDEKGQALAKLGINPEDAAYYNVARQNNDIKDIYVRDEIGKYGNNRQEMLLELIKLRREVNGKMILSDKVITSLYDDGIISYDEAKWLKNAKYTKGEQVKVKLSGRGRKARLKSITYRAKKLSYKVPKKLSYKVPKLKAIKVGGKGIPGRGRIFRTRKVAFK